MALDLKKDDNSPKTTLNLKKQTPDTTPTKENSNSGLNLKKAPQSSNTSTKNVFDDNTLNKSGNKKGLFALLIILIAIVGAFLYFKSSDTGKSGDNVVDNKNVSDTQNPTPTPTPALAQENDNAVKDETPINNATASDNKNQITAESTPKNEEQKQPATNEKSNKPSKSETNEVVGDGTSYTVNSNDNLWNIAAKKLGDPFRWKEIYELNKGIISDPNIIIKGQQLVMPK